jgi:hypothetical protein
LSSVMYEQARLMSASLTRNVFVIGPSPYRF